MKWIKRLIFSSILLIPIKSFGSVIVNPGGSGISSISTNTTGANSFIWNTSTLQSGATFYVSSGTALNLNTSTFTVSTYSLFQSVSSTTFQNVSTMTFSDGVLINMSAINDSDENEGLRLPQNTNCSNATAEGQVCWDTDDDVLNIGGSDPSQVIMGRDILQTGATFYVSSGTVVNFNSTSARFTSITWPNGTVQVSSPSASVGGSDNLGNHLATTTLNMATFGITNIGTSASNFTGGGGLVVNSSLTINSGTVAMSSITYGLTINSASTMTATGDFVALSSTAYSTLRVLASSPSVNIGGHIEFSTATNQLPILSGCGTSPSLDSPSYDSGGSITIGTGGIATSCTLTFGTAFSNPPTCYASHEGAILFVRTVTTNTSLVIDAATPLTASGKLRYSCLGRK